MFDNWGAGQVAFVNRTIDIANNFTNATNSSVGNKVVTIEYPDVFNFLYYLIVVLIIGFILFMFISAIHLGYSLIKR
jgi:large-conductance mechanosensitive channel